MEKYEFRSLRIDDLKQMHRSFVEAFSDYPVPMQPTPAQFEARMIHKLNIAFRYSIGAFVGENLAGFLLNTLNTFEGLPTLYNGGTGVIPGHRGNGLTRKMYEVVCAGTLPAGTRLLLETLTTNTAALKAYQQVGFRYKRFFLCYKMLARPDAPLVGEFEIRDAEVGRLEDYALFDSTESCFSDSFSQLRYNLPYEKVLECFHGDELVGYLIFQPEPGRISRMAVAPDFRRRGIGSLLIRHAFLLAGKKSLYVINVPEEATGIQHFLASQGFEHQVDQWEMELKL